MGTDNSRTEFPPAGEPKEDPKQTLGKTMEELKKEKKSGESIKHAPPGRSDIVP
jgi:hypothetical protein